MRIRIIRKPSEADIEGVRLDKFEVRQCYDVGTRLGGLMLSEGWAEPVDDATPAFTPLCELDPDDDPALPSNLVRAYPRDYDRAPAAAGDRPRRDRSPAVAPDRPRRSRQRSR